MKNILFALCCLFISSVAVCLATTQGSAASPTGGGMTQIKSITLNYDLDKAILHVEAVHPSDNWEKDYVRMMMVSLNGQMVSTLHYYRQTIYEGFSDDVPLTAKVGDVIAVELFCTDGSSKSEELTVVPPTAQPGPSPNVGTDNSGN